MTPKQHNYDPEYKVLLLGGTGLVGRAIYQTLKDSAQILLTAGHHELSGGYRLAAEEPERLLAILNKENPDVVISSIRGEFQAQLRFHELLADWLAVKNKRLLFLSTANVFDGDLSRPWTEADPPCPQSDYGIYKRDCEAMLQRKLSEQLIIFRLATVWAPACPRLDKLTECSRTGKPARTYAGNIVNISLAEQIGRYAKYVLDHDYTGIFHVGTVDTVDYFEFEKQVCKVLGLRLPQFEISVSEEPSFQAVIPARSDIPERLQMTVAQVLQALHRPKKMIS